MVLDSSALVAILRDEAERDDFLKTIASSKDTVISAATLVECSIVLHRKRGTEAVDRLDALLQAAGVRCVAVDAAQAHAAREAWLRFGKGRSPAKLNFGDCFSYALAITTGRPLLYKGEDFGHTDVQSAC